MQIWTTPNLNDLLLGDCLPVRLLPPGDVHASFLGHARPGDAAIFPFTTDFRDILESAKAAGLMGPIVFVSAEPTVVREETHQYNAVVFDLKTMGAAWVRDTIRLVLNLAMSRSEPAAAGDAAPAAAEDTEVNDDPRKIRDLLQFSVRTALPVIVSFEITELGERVSARGTCALREVRQDALVFHQFRQPILLRGIRKDAAIKAIFSAKEKNEEGSVTVRSVSDRELVTTLPERLYPIKDIRLQPNPKHPVTLYVLIPNEPTRTYRVIDISTRGIGFLCPRDLPKGNAFSFMLVLPDSQAAVVCSGVIRYKKDFGHVFRYGAEFQLHPWDEELIAQYIMRRELDILNVLRGG